MEAGSDVFRALTFGLSFPVDKKARVKNGKGPQFSGSTARRSKQCVEQNAAEGEIVCSADTQDEKNGPSSSVNGSKKRKMPASDSAGFHDQAAKHRKEHRIFTWGNDVLPPHTTFDDLKQCLHEKLWENLASFNFDTPTPVQMQCWPILLQRRELLAAAPTGSGKTLAFAVPLVQSLLESPDLNAAKSRPKRQKKDTSLDKSCRAVVLVPTKELAAQVRNVIKRLCKGLGLRCRSIINDNLHADILVTTPNRLIYALTSSGDNENQQHLDLDWLIVDESDKLFEAGDHGFRNQLAAIYNACDGGKRLRRAFFSATFSYDVEEWCKLNLNNVVTVCVGPRNSACTTVRQKLIFAGSEHGKLVAMRQMLRADQLRTPVLVFVQSKRRAAQLARELQDEFGHALGVHFVHSGISDEQRQAVVSSLSSGGASMLVCTELLGRGIDLPSVRTVINYDLPTSIVGYIHRVGRTGRAGASGDAVTFFTEDDLPMIRPIATVVKQANGEVPEYTLQLRKPTRNERTRLRQKAPHRKDIAIGFRSRFKTHRKSKLQ